MSLAVVLPPDAPINVAVCATPRMSNPTMVKTTAVADDVAVTVIGRAMPARTTGLSKNWLTDVAVVADGVRLPIGARPPFRMTPAPAVAVTVCVAEMALTLGAGKVKMIVDAIERLSGMDVAAVSRAEGNSLLTANVSSTSS